MNIPCSDIAAQADGTLTRISASLSILFKVIWAVRIRERGRFHRAHKGVLTNAHQEPVQVS